MIDGLLGLEDPACSNRAILIAGRKRDFAPMGAHGVGAGDVIFICRSGYQARNNRGAVFTPTRLFKEFTSGHDHFWPFDPKYRVGLSDVPWVVEYLRKHGGRAAWEAAARLCR